jgi:hypothetical protein
MLQFAVGAFVGAFSALLALAEVQNSNKLVRYFFALVVGLIVTVVLSLVVAWVLGLFHRVG